MSFVLIGSPVQNLLPANFPIITEEFNLLGSPIGHPPTVIFSYSRRMREVEEILARLSDLEDSQIEAILLQSCLSLLKVAFDLRSCPTPKLC